MTKPCVTLYSLAIVVSAISATVCKILLIKMCKTLTLTVRMGKVKCKYANGKAVCDFIFVGNMNVCPIRYNLQDVINQNVHDLDPDL